MVRANSGWCNCSIDPSGRGFLNSKWYKRKEVPQRAQLVLLYFEFGDAVGLRQQIAASGTWHVEGERGNAFSFTFAIKRGLHVESDPE